MGFGRLWNSYRWELPMANPQPDKYTRFSNDLLEKFLLVAPKLPPSAITVWLTIFRLTYGFQKKKAKIALLTLKKMTGMQIPLVCRGVKRLKLENMITNERGVRGIQKDYDKWFPLHKQPVAKRTVAKRTVTAQADSKTTAQTANNQLHVRTDYKDNIKKEDKEKKNSAHRAVVRYFCEKYLFEIKQKYDFKTKDGKLVKGLVAVHSLENIQIRIDTLFSSTKDFYKNNKTIGILVSCWNQLTQEGLGRQTRSLPKVVEKNVKAGLNYLKNAGYGDNTKTRISENAK